MTRAGRSSDLLITAGLLLAASLCSPSSAQEVGKAAAVNPSAQARGATGQRTVMIGQSIAHRERIQTTSSGSVQLLFLDKTSMTVGPNSDLSIDEYVYDPASNTGKLAASLTKGVMRFVGGQISHAGNAQISTSTAVVGIRGGVGIFSPNSVYIGYGEGVVTSGPSTLTLTAGEFVTTFGGNTPPSTPGDPPAGYLQSVIALLQSQAGQNGGAPKTAAQVERARRPIVRSAGRRIEEEIPFYLYWPFVLPTLAAINQTIHTQVATKDLTPSESGPDSPPPGIGGLPNQPPTAPTPNVPVDPTAPPAPANQVLTGFTGGLIGSIGANGTVAKPFPAFGVMTLQHSGNRSQANLTIASIGETSQNSLLTGNIQFGSVDPTLPAGTITINQFNQFVGTASALAPAVNGSNTPLSTINNGPLIEHQGVFVEVKPGSQLASSVSNALKTPLCQCDYTQWGMWDSQSSRPGPNNSSIDERAQMFWVAGRLPNVGDVPATGTATYAGHAIANISNGSQNYIAAGVFENVVNFGSRSGRVTVTGLDLTNYVGSMRFGSDPRFFSGSLSSVNMQGRILALSGSFFNGIKSPVGEMGGALSLNGPSYIGGGIFIGKMK